MKVQVLIIINCLFNSLNSIVLVGNQKVRQYTVISIFGWGITDRNQKEVCAICFLDDTFDSSYYHKLLTRHWRTKRFTARI